MLIPKRFLGIDIGTSYIKIAEISKFGHRRKLENYGSLSATVLYQKPFRTFEKNTLLLSSHDVARAIRAVIEEAKIKARQAVFSIPDFSTFFTNFELPQMSREELGQAVEYEARQHVPLPLTEVTLDWQVIEGKVLTKGEGKIPAEKAKLRILLVAVPKEVINQYREIARISQLELGALEVEVFGLKRALIDPEERRPIALIDIGAQSTTCNIIDRKTLKISYSFDMSGNELTSVISKGLNVDHQTAEELKKKYGLVDKETGKEVREILLPLIDIILKEVEKIFNNFYQKERKEIEKIIIAGGSALLPGLKEYLTENLRKEVEIANPFSNLFYPPILEKTLKRMGPSYAIAVGAALRGLEY
jgi:type IV pilus assembly protein PilM